MGAGAGGFLSHPERVASDLDMSAWEASREGCCVGGQEPCRLKEQHMPRPWGEAGPWSLGNRGCQHGVK